MSHSLGENLLGSTCQWWVGTQPKSRHSNSVSPSLPDHHAPGKGSICCYWRSGCRTYPHVASVFVPLPYHFSSQTPGSPLSCNPHEIRLRAVCYSPQRKFVARDLAFSKDRLWASPQVYVMRTHWS